MLVGLNVNKRWRVSCAVNNMLRKAVWRFLGGARLKSLLFLVIVLHVAIFVAVNFYSIPDTHEAGM